MLLLLIVLSLHRGATAADLSISCGEPSGQRLEKFAGKAIESSSDGYSGVRPLFRLREGSKELLVAWGWSKSGAKVRDDELTVATVLEHTDDRIVALEQSRSEFWLLAFHPKLGVGLFTRHARPFSGAANASVFSATCSFTVAN